MRIRTSLTAAVLASTVAAASVVPASAQPAGSSLPGINQEQGDNDSPSLSSDSCIAAGLTAGIPLLFLISAALATSVKVPGLEQLGDINTDIQRQIGMFDPRIAAEIKRHEGTITAAAGGLTAVLGVAAAIYLAQNCGTGSSDPVDPDPVDPDPVDPVDPIDPDPIDPEDPVDPEDPIDPDPVDPEDPIDPDPVDPDPVDPEDPVEPEEPGEIIVDDFVLIGRGTINLPVAELGTECTATSLPAGVSYDAASGALVGTVAALPSGDGGQAHEVTLTCGETSKTFTLQQHDYMRQPAAAVGNFDAFELRGITEATFTFAADAKVYDGRWGDANPIAERTVTVTKNADGTWSQEPQAFYITAFDESAFSVVATNADGREYTGTGQFGRTLYLR